MKHLKTILLPLLLLACGCSDDNGNEEPPAPYFQFQYSSDNQFIYTNDLYFPAERSEQSLKYSTNIELVRCYLNDYDSNDESYFYFYPSRDTSITFPEPFWITLQNSAKDSTLKIIVSHYLNMEFNRKCKLGFNVPDGTSIPGAKSDGIGVWQDRLGAIFFQDMDRKISPRGEIISLAVSSNVEYTVSIAPEAQEWIKEVQEKGRAFIENTLQFDIRPNNIAKERSGEIYFTNTENNSVDTLLVTQEPYSETYVGDILLTTKQDLKDFGDWGLKRVEGNLTISGNCDSIHLLGNHLEEVTGDLIIKPWSSIPFLEGLGSLKKIGNNLVINDCMSGVGLGNLKTIGGNFNSQSSSFEGLESLESIGGEFTVDDANSFKGLGNLATIGGGFVISGSFTDFTGLEKLTTIGGDFNVSGSAKDFMGLGGLVTIGGNFISNLASYTGLDKLTTIGGDFPVSSSATNFDGLNNLTTIKGNFSVSQSITNYSGLNNLNLIEGNFVANSSMEDCSGLNNLSMIGGDFIVNDESLKYFTGLENLECIKGNFNGEVASLLGFDGLKKLTTVGGDFSVKTSMINYKGLDNLTTIGGDFNISGSTNLLGFEGLEKLTSIGGDFILDVELKELRTFNGLTQLERIGGNLTIEALNIRTEELVNLTSIGGNLVVPRVVCSMKKLTSIGGDLTSEQIGALPNLESIGGDITGNFTDDADLGKLTHIMGNLVIRGSNIDLAPTGALQNVTIIDGTFEGIYIDKGLSKLESVGGNFEATTTVGFDNLMTIGGDVELRTVTGLTRLKTIGGDLIGRDISSFSDLKELTSIGGNFKLTYGTATSFDGLENLGTISGSLILENCSRLNNIDALVNLQSVKDISITSCRSLYDFCVLKKVVQETDCSFYTSDNGYNPTKYQLLNGECSPSSK